MYQWRRSPHIYIFSVSYQIFQFLNIGVPQSSVHIYRSKHKTQLPMYVFMRNSFLVSRVGIHFREKVIDRENSRILTSISMQFEGERKNRLRPLSS